ncbi:ABC transporter permease [Pengzhenrongella frigida]|uniref:ABC transporter permease n=1 Tax=Pengzhenrongella frigida TaxID=1259133 RepID=UPI0021026175|nr:ABC transporter permease [Cellulomonas sp. HLT2-17]
MTATTVQTEPSRSGPPGLLRTREMPVALALIALVLFTYLNNSRFLSAQGIKDLLLNSTIIVILAVGQALVIITRNVDLSVGSILGLVAFATGTLFATVSGIPIVVVFLAGMALGAALGAINGLLVTAAKVPALVITLGTLYIYRGLNNAWAGGKQYFADDRPAAFGALSTTPCSGSRSSPSWRSWSWPSWPCTCAAPGPVVTSTRSVPTPTPRTSSASRSDAASSSRS